MTKNDVLASILEFMQTWGVLFVLPVFEWLRRVSRKSQDTTDRVLAVELDLKALREGIELRNKIHDENRTEDRKRQAEDRAEAKRDIERMERLIKDGVERIEGLIKNGRG